MAKTVYALLAGIDSYPQPVRPLRGCTNDITRMETYLCARITGERGELKLRVLKNDAATRDAVIAGFREHLALAGQEDVALFYFSGHGSQEPAPKEFWHLEPDHLNETLVCYDSRLPGKYDLADKELAKLIAEVAVREAHIVVVLDSCHSGSGTRAGNDAGVRHEPADTRARPLADFLTSPLDAIAPPPRWVQADAGVPVSRPTSGWVELPEGSHVLLSACHADEEAKEDWLDGEHRGVFSHYLMETLQRSGESMTYRDLFKQVNAAVRSKVARQSPIIEANQTKDLNRPFLGGAVVPRPPYYTLSHQRGVGWVIDGGAVHGIAPVASDETTTLAVFPVGGIPTPLRELSPALASSRVVRVEPHQSRVDIVPSHGTALDTSQIYAAVVTGLPLPLMGVYLDGDAAGVNIARFTLHSINGGGPSLYVEEVTQEWARVCLWAEGDHYRFIHPRENRRLIADAPGQYDGPPGYSEVNARLAIERLEHIARWQRLADLSNRPVRLKPNAVQMELVRVADETEPGEAAASTIETEDVVVALTGTGVALTDVQLEYRFEHGRWKEPRFLVKLTNTTDQTLHCALVGLSQRYGVQSLTPGGSEQLGPRQVTWARGGRSIPASVPTELWEAGVTEVKDILRLIVSTEPIDALLLEQQHMEAPLNRGAGKGVDITHHSTLNRLMQRIQTRDYDEKDAQNVFADWTTSALSTTTVRPLESVPIPAKEAEVYLGHGVTLLGHGGLEATHATARLTTACEVGRSAGNLLLPEILRQDSGLARPWEFSSSRGGEPGLSVLELFDVMDPAVVTSDAPLRLRINTLLNEDEHVLPVAWDGEFFLPLGYVQQRDRQVVVTLERLPAPVAFGRDIKGSIRILFEKLVGKYFGSSYRYPLLLAAGMDDTGEVVYSKPQDVHARVAQAHTIVLFMHGIIGDTRGMVRSAYKPDPQSPHLAELYDLVLAFDYENLNTSIQQTAHDLQDRLRAVGLGPGHGKRLHIIAHSLGGLIARWFIEHLDGKAVVEHLVMLGTPNAGSPWPRVQALATAAVGLALNALTVVPWPLSLLGGLANGIEAIDVTLDQMQPGAQILDSLWQSFDPHMHYTVIAGNTSMREEALASEAQPEQPRRIERLMERLSLQHVLRKTTALAFFGQPNDIAVSVASITHVPLEREPRPAIKEVECDHMTYFQTDAALRTLTNRLIGAAG